LKPKLIEKLSTHLELSRKQVFLCLLYVPIIPTIAFCLYILVAALGSLILSQNILEDLTHFFADDGYLEAIGIFLLILIFVTVFYYVVIMIFAYFSQILFSKMKIVNFYTISISSLILALCITTLLEFSFPPSLNGLAFISSICLFYSSTFWFFAYRQHIRNIFNPQSN
jgi:cbb3-type cytochrome oxidase subunit 3